MSLKYTNTLFPRLLGSIHTASLFKLQSWVLILHLLSLQHVISSILPVSSWGTSSRTRAVSPWMLPWAPRCMLALPHPVLLPYPLLLVFSMYILNSLLLTFHWGLNQKASSSSWAVDSRRQIHIYLHTHAGFLSSLVFIYFSVVFQFLLSLYVFIY